MDCTLTCRPTAPSIIASVFWSKGSIVSSFSFSARCFASCSSFSFFNWLARFCCRVFFSAAPTRASSNRDKSFFFLLLFRLFGTAFIFPPGPSSASSAASSAAFSARFRAASSALAASHQEIEDSVSCLSIRKLRIPLHKYYLPLSSARDAPLTLAPFCQSRASWASRTAAALADFSASTAAFFARPASTFEFTFLGPILNYYFAILREGVCLLQSNAEQRQTLQVESSLKAHCLMVFGRNSEDGDGRRTVHHEKSRSKILPNLEEIMLCLSLV